MRWGGAQCAGRSGQRRRRCEQSTCARYLCMRKQNQKGSCFFGRKWEDKRIICRNGKKRRTSGCVIQRPGSTGHGCEFTQPTCRCQRHRNSGRVDNERRRKEESMWPPGKCMNCIDQCRSSTSAVIDGVQHPRFDITTRSRYFAKVIHYLT